MMGKSAEQFLTDTSLLSRRLFTAPRPKRLLVPIAAFSLLTAALLVLPSLTATDLVRTFLVVAVPIYGSALLTLAVSRLDTGRTYLRRTTLQAFVDLILLFGIAVAVAVGAALSWAVRGVFPAYPRERILLFGFAATVWVRQVVWTATYDHRPSHVFRLSSVTPFLGALAVNFGFPSTRATDILLWGALLAIFLVAGIAFTWAANRPIRNAFGANGIRLLRHLVDQMTGVTEESRQELETFFDSFAEPAEVRVAALAFRAPAGPVALLVATHAHPGPFGRTGGSDLPAKLRAALADASPVVLAPHGPSTHDYNPATSAECGKIAATVREVLRTARPESGGSHLVRAAHGKATATAQFFGDVALVTASLAPNPTDDIDDPTGHAAIRAAIDAGARDCLFVDAHNSAALAEGLVRFGSTESSAVIEATHRAVRAARDRRAASLRVGVAEGAVGGGVREGVGAQGLQVLAVEADGQRVAYLLFDANNMVAGLRDEILAEVRSIVDDGEVLTTDNHSVNSTMGGYNPIGARTDRDVIVLTARRLVRAAVADLRPVESTAASGTAHGLRVFGHDNTVRLTSSVNATISILRPMALLTFGLALSVALVVLALVQ